MAKIAYYRVSTRDQSVESQRSAMLGSAYADGFDEEFEDAGVSGAVPASDRLGFAALLSYARKGDTVYVSAVDRLGRDALDVQATVRSLLERGVAVEVHGLGRIARGVGELILAVLAQVADMERHRIMERTDAGRQRAKASLAETGLTHRGKPSLGRRREFGPAQLAEWRRTKGASTAATARHFDCSIATVKRCCST